MAEADDSEEGKEEDEEKADEEEEEQEEEEDDEEDDEEEEEEEDDDDGGRLYTSTAQMTGRSVTAIKSIRILDSPLSTTTTVSRAYAVVDVRLPISPLVAASLSLTPTRFRSNRCTTVRPCTDTLNIRLPVSFQ